MSSKDGTSGASGASQGKPTGPKKSVALSALAMSAGTLSSRVLGLARDILIASVFPALVRDAFVVAFRLPNMFRRLLGEGSLAASFIPLYIDQRESDPSEVKEKARAFASIVFSMLFLSTSLISVICIVFMEPLLGLLVSGEGFSSIQGKLELTVVMAQIMFSYLFLVTSYAFFMSLLNAVKVFFLPALAPALFNVGVIVFCLLPYQSFDFTGQQLALGVLFGGVLQVGLVVFVAAREKILPKLVVPSFTKPVQIFLRNLVPGIMGMGVLQLMGLANVYFASRLEQGSHFYIYLADRVLELPQSLIAISLGTALLPTLSELYSRGETSKMLDESYKHARLLFFLVLPSAVGLFFLAEPIVAVLFGRGQFMGEDIFLTSLVVQIYAFVLLASSFNKILVPGFYALKNTWLPAVTSACSLVFHLILANWLTQVMGLQGLVLSTACSAFLNSILLSLSYKKFVGPFPFFKLIFGCWNFVPALVAMAGVLYGAQFVVSFQWSKLPSAGLMEAFLLTMIIAVAAVVYFAVSLAMGLKEMNFVKRRFLKR